MKSKIWKIIFVLLAIALVWLGITTKNSEHPKARLTVVGSTALQPLAEKIAYQYTKDHDDSDITVQGGGSGTGLSQIQAGTIQIGDSDIFAQQQSGINYKKIIDHKVAVVGIVPVVEKHNPVSNLSMKQLQDIFTGKITNWKQVGGKDMKITVINRAAGSGTRAAFESAVFTKNMKPINAQEQDSNGTVKKIVSNAPGAISYLALPYVSNELKTLSVDHVKVNAKNISINKWKIWSYEHMYTGKHPNKATIKFINYVTSHKIQSTIVNESGYISIYDMKVKMNATGKVSEIKDGKK